MLAAIKIVSYFQCSPQTVRAFALPTNHPMSGSWTEPPNRFPPWNNDDVNGNHEMYLIKALCFWCAFGMQFGPAPSTQRTAFQSDFLFLSLTLSFTSMMMGHVPTKIYCLLTLAFLVISFLCGDFGVCVCAVRFVCLDINECQFSQCIIASHPD